MSDEKIVLYVCPDCLEPMKARHGDIGKRMVCPHCNHKHTVPTPPTEIQLNTGAVKHQYPCPSCGEVVRTSLKMVGRMMPCPHCSRDHAVPEAFPEPDAEESAVSE